MKQMEQDLGVQLTWMAVVHKNTANPHGHVLLKGTHLNSQDLIIKPDYISRGMRARSAHLLTLELGPRSELSIQQSKKKALLQNRAVAIDYKILEFAALHQGKFSPFVFKNPEEQKAASIRLKYLQSLNLVSKPEHWPKNFYQVDQGLVKKLKDLEAHHDIYKRISRSGIDQARQYNPLTDSLIGKVVKKGLQNELTGSYYMIVKGADGYNWYVDLTKYNEIEKLQTNSIVLLTKQTNNNNIKKSALYFDEKPKLSDLVTREGVTVLDRCIVGSNLNISFSDNELSRQLKQAIQERKEQLVNIDLAKKCDNQITVNRQLFNGLRARELEIWKNQLRIQGYEILNHTPDKFSGNLKKIARLSGRDYALVEYKKLGAVVIAVSKKDLSKIKFNQKITIEHGKLKLFDKKLSR